MSGYVRTIALAIPFEGREARLTLKPLKRGDFFKLQALLPKDDQDVVGANEAFEAYASMLKNGYVLDSAVHDAAGEPVPLEEWVDSVYYMNLLGNVMTEHMARALPANPKS